jgi:methylated-DNA-[protein]-cysteine S-methyltransferase
MLTLLQDQIDTPLGPLWIICDEQYRLRAVEWEDSDRMEQLLALHYRHEGYQRVTATNPGGLSRKLADYFAGDLALSTRFRRQRRARLFSVKSGKRCAPSPAGRSCTMVSSRNSWDDRALHARSAPPTVQIQSALWSPAIA